MYRTNLIRLPRVLAHRSFRDFALLDDAAAAQNETPAPTTASANAISK